MPEAAKWTSLRLLSADFTSLLGVWTSSAANFSFSHFSNKIMSGISAVLSAAVPLIGHVVQGFSPVKQQSEYE